MEQPIAVVVAVVVGGFAFACYPENIISLDFYNGPKGPSLGSIILPLQNNSKNKLQQSLQATRLRKTESLRHV